MSGDAAKRKAVQDFLDTGVFTPAPPPTGEEGVPPTGPLDPAWLADIQARRAALAANPATELERYRAFFMNRELSLDDVDRLLGTIEQVIADPESLHDALVQESIIGTIADVASCAWKIPHYFPTKPADVEQLAQIAVLRQRYQLPLDIDINPNEHHFELCDPGWWHLLRAKAIEKMQLWPQGLAPFIEHDATRSFIYPATRAGTKVALMADFGVGQYHSHAIARQLARRAYPYVFHLGDVYYGGTADEFSANYANVLDDVMSKSALFSMPENHELYSGGFTYQQFLRTELAKGRIVQESSYFCVRFAKHQIVAIDVNWNGRQRFRYSSCQEWFADVIRTGRNDGLTTILLTGSPPFAYGSTDTTELYDDLSAWHEQGHIDMWFWGDDHYCALFERSDKARFIGSCIGHGGYPGHRRTPGEPTFVPVTWVETDPRFPVDTGLRDDLSNNGWVEFAMLADGGVELTYIDWLGCKRFWARYGFVTTAGGDRILALADSKPFDRAPSAL